MYLGVSIVTRDKQPHDSKVIVPSKTSVRTCQMSHSNDLNCLNFDGCNSTDYFDHQTRHIYLKISPEEHDVRLKEYVIDLTPTFFFYIWL